MTTFLAAHRAGTLGTRNHAAGHRGLWARAGLLAVLAAILTTVMSAGMTTPVRANDGPETGVDGTPMLLEFLVEGSRCRPLVSLGRGSDPDPKVRIKWPDGHVQDVTEAGLRDRPLGDCGTIQGPRIVEIWPLYADEGGSDTGPWLPIYGRGLEGSDRLDGLGSTPDGDDPGVARLTRVVQWGELGTTSLRNAFNSHHGLTAVPDTLPPGVTDTGYMFYRASVFNDAGIANWNMTSVTSVRSLFEDAEAFNQPIGNWNVSNVRDMGNLFEGATAFNQPIGSWDVSSVTDMGDMFKEAAAFNQPIGSWNVSSVTDMREMFRDAVAFNQDLSNWERTGSTLANVTTMRRMFRDAASFDRSVGNWTLNADVNLQQMLNNSGMSSSCYDATLIGWAALDPAVSGLTLDAVGLEYSPDGAAARTVLVDDRGWTITEGTTVDVATGRCADSVAEYSVSPTLGMTLGCTPPDPAVGVKVTCTVTGGAADIDVLWRAAYNPVFAEAGLTLDANGSGTFSFVVPAAALGQTLTVELVEWTQPMTLGVVGGLVPASVPAGEGSVPFGAVLLALLAAAGVLVAGRRLVTAG